ncbi:uncharacterized protein BP01DRAFT_221551 [Aspergillus saccharolyticus JOP 1030-1]|uniref:Uncharacterized protein n=1 Tax=Aspergillus saccharolyticus JOP 1030-1 TaxID=1450539 RepID=A0A318ZJB0_9EURO|nr:hypothetical protein BP01DRAFT_221551 [Aspergillus saccharolyticus JOP 1030-1]PYH40358.1 hypothetical protein BP01DRAFT_221551 [Aspergillus saccharolyticus JOP 1030-1]
MLRLVLCCCSYKSVRTWQPAMTSLKQTRPYQNYYHFLQNPRNHFLLPLFGTSTPKSGAGAGADLTILHYQDGEYHDNRRLSLDCRSGSPRLASLLDVLPPSVLFVCLLMKTR